MVDAHRLAPDRDAEPSGFLVETEPGTRVHFLDWGIDQDLRTARPVLLIHGIGQTAWAWAPVARRLRSTHRVAAMDLRGHGLSDSPRDGYDAGQLAEDALAVAEGAGLLGWPDAEAGDRAAMGGIVLAGHGFGAIVAARSAIALGDRCVALVLVDGGVEDLGASGADVDEFERDLAEPPEVMRSMEAFLADRAAFDPSSWNADQERAARSTVVEVPAGHLVPSIRPQAFRACLETMVRYSPVETLGLVPCPVLGLLAGAIDGGSSRASVIDAVQKVRARAGFPRLEVVELPGTGHNLMRYRPDEVAAAIAGAGRPERPQ